MKNQAVSFKSLLSSGTRSNNPTAASPFSVMFRKEVAGIVHSWRFIVLIILIGLTFFGSMYVSLSNISKAMGNRQDPDHLFMYLKLLTTTDNTLPAFHVFISFLGPLLGISLGFDAINSEQNSGTLIRLMAQPIYRDNVLLAKFSASLFVIFSLLLSLSLLMIGGGLIITGVRMEPSEFLRIIGFVIVSTIYVGFWISLSILFSIKFKQAAASALTAIGIWMFFTIFYQLIINLVVKAFLPDPALLSQDEILSYNHLILTFLRFSPSQIYSDAVITLLMPSVRSLGPLTMEQMSGAIPAPLSLRDSLMVVWPQVTGLIAATLLCFALSYYLFMRKEIRT
ncbi:MAG: ABC transporter permease subunit [Arachidicoccus sp.]|nr:ABC transporter permease subunit [Arachidicoccus sp.]